MSYVVSHICIERLSMVLINITPSRTIWDRPIRTFDYSLIVGELELDQPVADYMTVISQVTAVDPEDTTEVEAAIGLQTPSTPATVRSFVVAPFTILEAPELTIEPITEELFFDIPSIVSETASRRLDFVPFGNRHTSLHIETNIRQKIENPLTVKELEEGFIYILIIPSDPSHVKIGVTGDPSSRFRKHRKCYGETLRKCWQSQSTKNAERIEKIIHAELAERHRQTRHFCTSCRSRHREWFEAELEFAVGVAEKWIERANTNPHISQIGHASLEWINHFLTSHAPPTRVAEPDPVQDGERASSDTTNADTARVDPTTTERVDSETSSTENADLETILIAVLLTLANLGAVAFSLAIISVAAIVSATVAAFKTANNMAIALEVGRRLHPSQIRRLQAAQQT